MVVGTAREYNDLQGEHGVANISLSLELQVCSTCPTPTESDETSSMTIVPIYTTDALSTTLLTTQQSGTTTGVASTAEKSKQTCTDIQYTIILITYCDFVGHQYCIHTHGH